MKTPRINIEQIKKDFAEDIQAGLKKYRQTVIRKVIYLYATAPADTTMEDILRTIKKEFQVPDMTDITRAVKSAEKEIAQQWDKYFSALGRDITTRDIDRISAAAELDFNALKKDIKSKLVSEFNRAITGDYGFEVLRRRLITKGIAEGEASTLANTSIAQFDNIYMTQTAAAAGIDKFLYDGSAKKNTRQFCLFHLGNTYTIEQLKSFDNGQGLPVEKSLGGYNCTHYLTPILE